nr:unnamed protein product [Timema californicum]
MAASSVNEVQLCFWDQLAQLHCTWYGSALIIIGTVGVALNCWFVSSFLQKELQTNRAHLILLNLAIACLGHGLFGGFTFSGTSSPQWKTVECLPNLPRDPSTIYGRAGKSIIEEIGTSPLTVIKWLFGEACCQMFGFMRTLFGCCQTSSLTILGVERALSIRWTNTGRRLALRYYVIGIILCWMLALTLAVLPLLGHGRYSCDVTGTACDYDWTSIAEPRHLAFNLCLLLLATLLPLTVAHKEHSHVSSPTPYLHKPESFQSRIRLPCMVRQPTAVVLVFSMILLWLPRSLVVLWSVSLSEQATVPGLQSLPPALATLGPLGVELSTVVPMLACLTHAPRIRVALLGKRASLIEKLPPAKL